MMEPVHRIMDPGSNPLEGRVRLDWAKLLWNGGMMAGAVAAPIFATPYAVILFLLLTYMTLLLGHSVGMHRMMIHRGFHARPWLEHSLVYLGTLVGMGGPRAIIETHDIRDWAQRAPHCHDYFSHRRGYLRDVSWQLFCCFDFDHPPKISVEPRYSTRFHRHLDRWWRVHVLATGAVLFSLGGLPWLLWGLCARVSISALGHWSVTWACHSAERPKGRYCVPDAGVQASDLTGHWLGRAAGLLTHGECWHSNHHAFPESARTGLYAGQWDPAAWVVERLAAWGLAGDVRGPRGEAARGDLAVMGDKLGVNRPPRPSADRLPLH